MSAAVGLIGVGHDSTGRINVCENEPRDRKVYCQRCKGTPSVFVKFLEFEIGEYAKKANNLIIKPDDKVKVLGVTCGCYAIFHRQLAHIEQGRRNRAS